MTASRAGVAGGRRARRRRLAERAALAGAASLALLVACTAAPGRRIEEPELQGLLERTARARGQAFVRPLDARAVPQQALPRLAERELAVSLPPERLVAVGRALEALGLLPPGTDLRRAFYDLHRQLAAGYYTPLLQRIYIALPENTERRPGTSLRGVDAGVLVHELTHALQAMHSQLLDVALGVEHNDDLLFAIGATLEGQALWTEYRDQELELGLARPTPRQVAAELDPDALRTRSRRLPRVLVEPFVRQYPAGYALAFELERRDGMSGLDAALSDPPLSSEQVLHPERYLDRGARDPPRFLTLPPLPQAPQAACAELERNTLGELGLRIWLRERLKVTAESVQSAADGWAGDRLVVFACRAGLAFGWLIELDDDAEAAELRAYAQRALAGLGTGAGLAAPARVDGGGQRVLLSAGLDGATRAALLEHTRAHVYADFAAWLAAHPEVHTRAEALRRRAREGG